EDALHSDETSVLVSSLSMVESFLQFAAETLPSIRERLDAAVFRDTIRPLLYGHTRLIFRGVPGEPRLTYLGETGAQSGAIRGADALLGIRHSEGMLAT